MSPVKKSTLLFIVLVALFIPATIFAQDYTNPPQENVRNENAKRKVVSQPENDADRNTVRKVVRERVETKRATITVRLTARKQANVQSRWQKLNVRLSAIITRLETLIERIESRIAIIAESEEDVDTIEVEASLAEAKSLLEQAKLDLVAANSLLEQVLASDDPKQAFVIVADTIKEIKKNIVEIHKILVLTIGNIRKLRVE